MFFAMFPPNARLSDTETEQIVLYFIYSFTSFIIHFNNSSNK